LELKFLLGMELEWSWSDLPPELPISGQIAWRMSYHMLLSYFYSLETF
jgi:hypothetical protein